VNSIISKHCPYRLWPNRQTWSFLRRVLTSWIKWNYHGMRPKRSTSTCLSKDQVSLSFMFRSVPSVPYISGGWHWKLRWTLHTLGFVTYLRKSDFKESNSCIIAFLKTLCKICYRWRHYPVNSGPYADMSLLWKKTLPFVLCHIMSWKH
jgi:hypothetical protein